MKTLFSFINADDIIIPENINNGKYNKPIKKLNNIKIKYPEKEEFIKSYFKTRLGIDEIPEEFNILSMKDFNRLTSYITVENDLPELTEVIPILTFKNRKISARVLNNKFYRYFNYELQVGSDCYIIKNKRKYIDFKKHNTVVIAEGPFDIMNQYIHKFVDVPDDSIYAATMSKAMSASFKVIRGLSLSYSPNIVLLADNDTDDNEYLYNKNGKPQFTYNSIRIYRNKKGKDFGEQIVEPELSFSKNIDKYE